MHKNRFSGTLPEAVGSWVEIDGLQLHENSFSGPLPEALGKLAPLNKLCLLNNSFQGCIPDAMGSMMMLSDCQMGFNSLRGLGSQFPLRENTESPRPENPGKLLKNYNLAHPGPVLKIQLHF